MRAFDIKKAGERLRALRIDAGLGLKEIAEEFYLSNKSVVYSYEHGRRGIPLDVVAMYSDKFGVTTDWILLGVTPKYMRKNLEIHVTTLLKMHEENMEELNTIGKRLRFLRESAGYTQEKLASLLYLGSRSSIAAYENGNRKISVDTLERYSKQFNVTTDWIVKGVEKDTSDIEKLYYSLGNADLQKIAVEQMKVLAKLR